MCAGPTQPSRILRLSFSAKPVHRFRVKYDGDVNHSRRETCKPLTTDETEADVADHQSVGAGAEAAQHDFANATQFRARLIAWKSHFTELSNNFEVSNVLAIG
jgi:hypothetical protein